MAARDGNGRRGRPPQQPQHDDWSGPSDAAIRLAVGFAIERALRGQVISVLAPGLDVLAGDRRWRACVAGTAQRAGVRVDYCLAPSAEGKIATLYLPSHAHASAAAGVDNVARLVVSARHGIVEAVAACLDSGIAPGAPSAEGVTALHAAARGGHVRVLRLLLERGADPCTELDRNGATALCRAARHGHARAAAMLLDSGAQLDAQTAHGMSALMLAARAGHEGTVALLCARGADLSAVSHDGCSALDHAQREGHARAAAALVRVGARRADPRRARADMAGAWWFERLAGFQHAALDAPRRRIEPRAAEPRRAARAAAALIAGAPNGTVVAQRALVDPAMRENAMPHDGGPWRTRAVVDAVRSEEAGARVALAREHATLRQWARFERERDADEAAMAVGGPLPYRRRALPLPGAT